MLKGKRKLVLLPVLLIILAAGYSFASAKPAPKLKIRGTVYSMPKSFLLNLAGGHYLKLDVALVLAPGQPSSAEGATASSAGSGGEGEGTLPEEPVVRDIITNLVTGQSTNMFVREQGRRVIKRRILAEIRRKTDVKIEAVLFPELTVQ